MKFDDKALAGIRKAENELVKNVAKQIEDDMTKALFAPLLIKKADKIYTTDYLRHSYNPCGEVTLSEPRHYINAKDIRVTGKPIKKEIHYAIHSVDFKNRECPCSGQILLREGHIKPRHMAPKEKKKIDNRIKCQSCFKLYLKTELDGFNGQLNCIKCFAKCENVAKDRAIKWSVADWQSGKTIFEEAEFI